MRKNGYSFKQWCLDNNRKDLLERWDYDLNDKIPNEVSYKSNNKFWFKCPRKIHESQLQNIQYFAAGKQTEMHCNKCDSFAQYIIDTYDKKFLNKIWSDKNEKSPWEYKKKSCKKVWFNCLNNKEHIYDQTLDRYVKGCACPFCSHKRFHPSDSLGKNYPEVYSVWSNKNTKTPDDYYSKSSEEAWFKCEYEIHSDFKRKIYSSTNLNFRCPTCAQKNKKIVRGKEHPHYKGTTTASNLLRRSAKYKEWRDKCYIRDKYTCQCCGKKGVKIQCHHIYSFALYEDIRLDINNGITLCEDCHEVSNVGSFHNLYGTLDNTPEQLEEYINFRREQLGIDIPFTIEEYISGNILTIDDIDDIKQ